MSMNRPKDLSLLIRISRLRHFAKVNEVFRT